MEVLSRLTFRCIAIRVGIRALSVFGGLCFDRLSGRATVKLGRYVPLLKYLYYTVSIVNRSYVATSSCIQRCPSPQQCLGNASLQLSPGP